MNDKQLLEMLEVLGRNSNSRRSMSLAASDSMTVKEREDQLCADTIKKIVENTSTNTNRRSFAASAPSPSPSVNRVKVLTQFIFRNGKI